MAKEDKVTSADTQTESERLARIGAGSHCTVLKGECVTPHKIAAAQRFYRSREEFRDIKSMQELGTLLNNLQS